MHFYVSREFGLSFFSKVIMGPQKIKDQSSSHSLFGRFTIHVPNWMSLVRVPLGAWIYLVFLIPSLRHCFWQFTVHLAFWGICLLDFLDGRFARKWNAITEDGKALDPAADKIVTFFLALCAYQFGELCWWALVIVLMRELISIVQRHRMKRLGIDVSAKWLGKIKTGVQFAYLYILILRIDLLPGTVFLDKLALLFQMMNGLINVV